ncbi:MAG: ribulose phosphate epimerase [Myxococcales bacterium]|nr:ribulose phosphate epimerase [Myxococcales bacterium]
MRAPLLTICVVSVLWACGDDKPASTNQTTNAANGEGSGDSGAGNSDTGVDPTTGVGGSAPGSEGGTTAGSTGGATEVGGSSSGGGTFIVMSDGGAGTKECDNWAQDCPEGQKCMPYADNGSNAWNATKCVDVPANPGQPGDECNVEGSAVSGLDSCDKGVMCWDVDPNTQMGVCVGLCTGSVEAPVCDSDHTCFVSNDGVLNLCLDLCDPLAQDCAGDDLCIPNPQGQGEFTCVLDASGEEGQAFDPCEYINACDKGLFCANPALGGECDPAAIGCCLPFCDLSAMVVCPGAGQECTAWFEAGTAPPGYEQVGFCGVPM